MPAIAEAVRDGFRHVETDVRVTADGVPLLCHDPDLRRLFGIDRPVRRMRLADVRRTVGRDPIPTLEDVLARWPTIRLNIDLKHRSAVQPVVDVLKRLRALDRVCLTSFNDFRIAAAARALRSADPQTCFGLGVAGSSQVLLSAALHLRHRYALPYRPSVMHVPLSIGLVPVRAAPIVRAAHSAGLQVHFWTANEPCVIETLVAAGADGIISDDGPLLRKTLQRLNRWPS